MLRGAPSTTGQVLVFHDVLGLTRAHRPKFVRAYADGFQLLQDALSHWAADVRSGAFPESQESYRLPEALADPIANWTPPSVKACRNDAHLHLKMAFGERKKYDSSYSQNTLRLIECSLPCRMTLSRF